MLGRACTQTVSISSAWTLFLNQLSWFVSSNLITAHEVSMSNVHGFVAFNPAPIKANRVACGPGQILLISQGTKGNLHHPIEGKPWQRRVSVAVRTARTASGTGKPRTLIASTRLISDLSLVPHPSQCRPTLYLLLDLSDTIFFSGPHYKAHSASSKHADGRCYLSRLGLMTTHMHMLM